MIEYPGALQAVTFWQPLRDILGAVCAPGEQRLLLNPAAKRTHSKLELGRHRATVPRHFRASLSSKPRSENLTVVCGFI